MHGAVALGAQAMMAPSFRIRAAALRPHLHEHGVRLDLLPLLTSEDAGRFATAGVPGRASLLLRRRRAVMRALASGANRWDTAFIHRQADLLPLRSVERAAMHGRRLVLDVDDAIWLDTMPEAGGHPLARLKDSARKVVWLASAADEVVAGNELLAEWLGRHARRVHVVPSLVDVDALPVRVHQQREPALLGWIGSPSTAAYLPRLAPALSRLACALPDRRVEFVVMGGPAPRIDGVAVREVAWSEDGELQLLQRMDVGLMPLPDTPWTRGKCAYKALLYLAAGVPAVCDDVGVSAEVVAGGGLVAGDAGEWTDALVTLLSDDGLRARLGAAGRQRVAAGFSVGAWAPRLASILRGGPSPADAS